MTELDLEKITGIASKHVKEVGEFIRHESTRFKNSSVELKGFNDLVSYVDKTAEIKLVDGLKDLIPNAGFLLEEKTSKTLADSEFQWIIDPLDGTTNFVHGVPCYSISVALAENKNIIAGIIYEINLDEMFTAWKDGGSFLNGKPIQVSSANKLSESLIATGFPYIDFSFMSKYMEVFNYCMKNTRGLRRLGSAAVDLAYVACGRFDVFYEYGLNPWDVAAGTIIVKEAGGKVTDFNNGLEYIFGNEILASNNKVHNEFLDVTKKAFGYS